jgi:hypothetical protein
VLGGWSRAVRSQRGSVRLRSRRPPDRHTFFCHFARTRGHDAVRYDTGVGRRSKVWLAAAQAAATIVAAAVVHHNVNVNPVALRSAFVQSVSCSRCGLVVLFILHLSSAFILTIVSKSVATLAKTREQNNGVGCCSCRLQRRVHHHHHLHP